jgi:hypothetical protein
MKKMSDNEMFVAKDDVIQITPKGLILHALGGYEKSGKNERLAKKVEKELYDYMRKFGYGLLAVNGRLNFSEFDYPEFEKMMAEVAEMEKQVSKNSDD